MLTTLHIQNLALIDDLSLEFDAGLNIVTGETGAGKSVIIGAVQLLLGQRADKGLIRTGAERCELNAVFDLSATGPLLDEVNGALGEAGIPLCEDGQLLLTRVLTARTVRNHVNSRPVTLQVLAQLGDLLVDVHGPYDHQSLLRPARQLAVLDLYAGLRPLLQAYHVDWERRRTLQQEIAAAEAEIPSPEMIDILRHQLDDITKAKLSVDEEGDLTARHARAANSQGLLDHLATCRSVLEEDEPSLFGMTARLHRELDQIARLDDARGTELLELADAAIDQLRTLSREIEDYLERLDLDPRALEVLDARVTLYQRLKRKYGGTVESVLAYAQTVRDKLHRLEHHADFRQELRDRATALDADLRRQATALTKARRAAVGDLSTAVVGKLRNLGFPKAGFSIRLDPAELGPTGMDAAEYLFCPNPGEPDRALRAIASAGEISRVMLALKTVLAEADDVPVLIFDEVDSNIGGRVALRVGAELRQLGRGRQVLCITHQPQVAAGADRHFRVDKHVDGDRTRTVLEVLNPEARLRELARMLGGDADSDAALQHARDLVKNTEDLA